MLKQIKDSPNLAQFKALHPNLNTLVIIFAIIMLWRGVWGLLDTYLFPGSPVLSYLAGFGIGAVILYLDDFSIDNLKR